MNIDLSPLLKAAKKVGAGRRGFSSSAVFSLPEVAERSKRVASRHLETTPFRVLDAPGLVDDYYLNLLDWTENRISIALADTVYCYNTDTKEVSEVFSTSNEYISSVRGTGNTLFIGDSAGKLYVCDLDVQSVTTRSCHSTRICAIAISDRHLSTGDRSGVILNSDLRSPLVTELRGHTHEICGLKWSNEYLASGSNDNTVRIWKAGSLVSRVLRGHESAVKAMDWCPWKSNILATGGGTKDKSIRFWDVSLGRCVKTFPVTSQVCTLMYLNRYKEILTGHGYHDNDLRIWRASDMKTVSRFGSHDGRVLHTALSPDQCLLASVGSDDSLKLWNIAEPSSVSSKRDSIGLR